MAGDLSYPQAPAGSPLYQPASVVTAQLDIFGGVIAGSGTYAGGLGLVVGGAARAAVPIHNGWNLQLDVAGMKLATYDSLDANAFGLDHTNFGVAARLYQRTGWGAFSFGIGDEHRASTFDDYKSIDAGLLVGMGVAGSGAGVPFGVAPGYGEDGMDRMPTRMIGGGSDLFLTANASVGWLAEQVNNGTAFTGQAGLLWWMSRHTSFSADAMVSRFNIAANNTTVVTGALGFAHRFPGTPWGVLAQGRVDSYSGDVSATTASVVGGIRVYVDPPGTDARGAFDNAPVVARLPLPSRL